MNFPIINTIDDVLPFVKDREGFVVGERDGFTYIDYVIQHADMFPDISTDVGKYLRECRGLIFNHKGDIVSRPFHKFHNLGERPETQNVDFSKRHIIKHKLDGSMIRPFELLHGIRWGTRAGITDVSLKAEQFVARNHDYYRLAKMCLNLNMTPIFEYVGPGNRIVVDYSEENLILTDMRVIDTGEYLSYDGLKYYARQFNIPVVDYVQLHVDMDRFIEDMRHEEGSEGYIISFDNGEKLKLKNLWYVNLHRFLSYINSDQKLLRVILDGNIDDIKPNLDIHLDRVLRYEDNFWRAVRAKALEIEEKTNRAKEVYGDRKAFALANPKNDLTRSLIFNVWDGRDAIQSVLSVIEKNTRTETAYRNFKGWLGLQ